MQIGETVTDVQFSTTANPQASFSDYQGQWLILYFYPKDATPGCTTEGQNFRDSYEAFRKAGAEILGISRDSLSSHERFKAKQNFPFELISDADEAVCTLFDVIKMKSMYGKEVRGIERSTFLIDPQGILRKSWRKVSVAGHVDEVLNCLRTFQGESLT